MRRSFLFAFQYMPFDLSGLTNYTKDNADVLIASAITSSKTAALIMKEGHVQTGIKTSERIMDFDTDAVLQDGDGCGFNSSGTTKITTRTITVKAVKVNEQLCLADLNAKYTQLMLQQGSGAETLPGVLEKVYVDRKAAKMATANEKLIWQGDTSLTGDATRKWIDGFLTLLDAAVGPIAANAKKGLGTMTSTTGATAVTGSGSSFSSRVVAGDRLYSGSVLIGTVSSVNSDTSITLTANGAAAVTGAAYTIVPAAVGTVVLATAGLTSANIIAAVKSVYLAIPEAVLDNIEESRVYIFMGLDAARLHLQALSDANLFNYKVNEGENYLKNGYEIPGTMIKVMPVSGLSGTSRIVASAIGNMWLGTDLENEFEQFKMWFSEDDDVLKFKAKERIGVQWGFPAEVAQFLGA